MDPSKYNVVYVDRRVREDRILHRDEPLPFPSSPRRSNSLQSNGSSESHSYSDIIGNLQALLAVFPTVWLCSSGPSCVSTLADIAKTAHRPTLLLLDIPWNEKSEGEPMQAPDGRHDSGYADILYGIPLLRFITSEMERNRISSLVVPCAIIAPNPDSYVDSDIIEKSARAVQCADLGAVEVLRSPFAVDRAGSLAVQCYKAAARLSKSRGFNWASGDSTPVSTPGVVDYLYLREKMCVDTKSDSTTIGHSRFADLAADMDARVSELIAELIEKPRKAILNSSSQLRISPTRMDVIRRDVGRWHFSAHDFSDDELLQCAVVMLEHALKMPEVEQYRIPSERLVDFLAASRQAYNDSIPYHNFRHVVDVLQACFCMLLEMGALPTYTPSGRTTPKMRTSKLSPLIRPVDALTLLISAVGHDTGHPGVNNAFLVNLKSPLAQLYNDKSVLECFHAAAFSQVLKRYWPNVQTNEIRKAMIDIILATDMQLHFDYMGKLDALKKKLYEENGIEGWDEKTLGQYRILLLSLIIKCADISNVARGHHCAAQWAIILTDEFYRQATMESDLGIPSALAVPPKPGSMLALAKSQCGFMTLFAIPLFKSLTEVVPELSFSVDQLQSNIEKWNRKVKDCELVDQPASLKYLKPNGVGTDSGLFTEADGEARQTPSSLSNSRRSSAIWSDGPNGRHQEETPRSSTGSPIPGTRSSSTLSNTARNPASRSEPAIVLDDAPVVSEPMPTSLHRNGTSVATYTTSTNGYSKKSPATTEISQVKPYYATNYDSSYPFPQSNNLPLPPDTHPDRPKSSPSDMREVDADAKPVERDPSKMKRPSRFFSKVKNNWVKLTRGES